MQPSAQGIASMFMGNPGALAARVDQDRKQSPMGIPDDLRQLMALNIVTNETDAAKRQQAMNELQQMAPNGQPPTVADSVRQQAAQKLQARMVQEQQKAQAMQQMVQGLPAAGIPQGVPQPERQPQGIDQAPVEFGMASGGIVSFAQGDLVKLSPQQISKLYEVDPKLAEQARRGVLTRAALSAVAPLLPAAAVLGGGAGLSKKAAQMMEQMTPEQRQQFYENEMVGALAGDAGIAGAILNAPEMEAPSMSYGEQMKNVGKSLLVDAPLSVLKTLVSAPGYGLNREEASDKAVSAPIPPEASAETEKLRRLAAARSQTTPAPAPASRRAPPTAGLPAAIAAARPAPESQPAAQPATPAFEESITYQGVLNQAEAERLKRQAEYAEKVGKPSTAAIDRLMAEYERQKAEAAGPQPGIAGLTEYLAQIAATPRGMTSFEAGAAGARGVQALEKERAARRAGLTEKQIELEQKRLDADRQYAKEVLGVGDAQYDRALKANLSLFEEQGKNKRQAMQDASAMAREQFRVEAERDLAKLRFQYQKELQAMPGQEERIQNRLIAAYKKKFPDADEYTILQAITAKGDRAASPGEQLRAVELINQLGGTPEDIQAGLGVARRVAGVNQQKVMTMADVKATAKARNMTEQQVMDVAKAKGYVIQ